MSCLFFGIKILPHDHGIAEMIFGVYDGGRNGGIMDAYIGSDERVRLAHRIQLDQRMAYFGGDGWPPSVLHNRDIRIWWDRSFDLLMSMGIIYYLPMWE